MKKIVFATNNKNKALEVEALLEGLFKVETLASIGCVEDIPETADSLEGNALQKSTYVFGKFKVDCFADDTGLEVEALNGAPGIFSARYAGSQRNSENNIQLLLDNLENNSNRKARFRTVVSLVINGEYHSFEGIAEGEIIKNRNGREGFGYDPIFKPLGYDITFAEMSKEEKNAISHRGKAIRELVGYLKSIKTLK